MKKNSAGRRRFLHQVSAFAGLSSMLIFGRGMKQKPTKKNMFVHHVYFWLKNPDSAEDLAKLIEGLEKLRKVKTIRMSHIGRPASTNRDVIDRSYSISWLLFFDSLADEESYQKDPIHLDFVEKCSPLWKKVVVYDSVDA
jgi:hypothetical protein